MKLPSYKPLSANYPTGTADEVKKLVGGKVDAAWITNTCTVRLSRSLNYAGDEHKVPKEAGLFTVSGADHLQYALRVTEMKTFLKKKYGLPQISESANDGVVDKSKFNGKNGIICFDVEGWKDASGHFTLWDGSSLLYGGEHDYFSLNENGVRTTKGYLWECPTN